MPRMIRLFLSELRTARAGQVRHLRAVKSVSKQRESGRAFLYIAIVMLQMCQQVCECEFSLRGGRIGVSLEGDGLRRKCNSLIHSSTRGYLHDKGQPIHRALKEVSTWFAGSFFPLPSLSLAFWRISH